MDATKEYIHQTIDQMGETGLNEVYRHVKKLTSKTTKPDGQSLFSKLRQIQIDGPEDLAADCDNYVLGKKHA